MSDTSKIQWEGKAKPGKKVPKLSPDSFEYFLNYCTSKLPSQNMVKSYEAFLAERMRLHGEMQNFIEAVSQQPLLTAYLAWVKEISMIPTIDLNLAKQLLELGLIGVVDKKGEIWTISKARDFDHQTIIHVIRCHPELSTEVKENLAGAYISFIQWLSNVTFGYIDKLEDPDLLRSQARALPYAMFLQFIHHLGVKDRLVAKLLYFGGSRTLEEILEMKIENIHFDDYSIKFNSASTVYPTHIFTDLKELVKGRKKGKVFLGRQNATLNPATIFRNFKNAAIESGLGEKFTPKVLTTNK